MQSDVLRTPTGTCYLDAYGIVHDCFDAGVEETLADAQASVRVLSSLFGEGKRPLLVDMRLIKSQTRDARAFYAGQEASQYPNAVALLIGSRISMVIANFFLSVTKSTVPTKLFTDEAVAIEWLKEFLA